MLKKARENPEKGLRFARNAFKWHESMIVTVNDASFAGEENHHSQSGRLLLLADPKLRTRQDAGVHIVYWSSTTIRRVCRATLQAEMLSTTAGSEEAQHLRALLHDAEAGLSDRDWEVSASASRQILLCTDCKSLEQAVTRLTTTSLVGDKRLAIDLRGLRQDL